MILFLQSLRLMSQILQISPSHQLILPLGVSPLDGFAICLQMPHLSSGLWMSWLTASVLRLCSFACKDVSMIYLDISRTLGFFFFFSICFSCDSFRAKVLSGTVDLMSCLCLFSVSDQVQRGIMHACIPDSRECPSHRQPWFQLSEKKTYPLNFLKIKINIAV